MCLFLQIAVSFPVPLLSACRPWTFLYISSIQRVDYIAVSSKSVVKELCGKLFLGLLHTFEIPFSFNFLCVYKNGGLVGSDSEKESTSFPWPLPAVAKVQISGPQRLNLGIHRTKAMKSFSFIWAFSTLEFALDFRTLTSAHVWA